MTAPAPAPAQREADLVRAAYYAGWRDAVRAAVDRMHRTRAVARSFDDDAPATLRSVCAEIGELEANTPPMPPPVPDLDDWIDAHPESPAEARWRAKP